MSKKQVRIGGTLLAFAFLAVMLMAPGPGGRGPRGGPGGGRPDGGQAPPGLRFLAWFDANHDRQITKDEWQDGWTKIFTAADTSKDGALDKAEAKAAGEKLRDALGGGGEGKGDLMAKLKAMDTNGDGKISKDEWKGRPEMFAKLDANGDGFITQDELQAAHEKMGKGGADLAAKLKAMDANGDGKISKDEWKGRPEMFAKLDANSDGFITSDELKAAHEKMGQGQGGEGGPDLGKGFDAIDTDHSGTISRQELLDWADKMFARLDTNGDGSISEADRSTPGPRPMPPHRGKGN